MLEDGAEGSFAFPFCTIDRLGRGEPTDLVAAKLALHPRDSWDRPVSPRRLGDRGGGGQQRGTGALSGSRKLGGLGTTRNFHFNLIRCLGSPPLAGRAITLLLPTPRGKAEQGLFDYHRVPRDYPRLLHRTPRAGKCESEGVLRKRG